MTTSTSQNWDSSSEPLILKNKTMETHDTASLYFQTPNKAKFNFKPGQFITLKAEIDGYLYGRSYSMTSLPDQDILQLTVKRVDGGVVSNWLIDKLELDQAVWTYGIAGNFNAVDLSSKKKALLLSSGCGIAPIMSIAQYLLNGDGTKVNDIMFIYRAVDARSIIFLDRLLELQKQYPHFKAFLFLKEGDPEGLVPEEISYEQGTLTQNALERITPDFHERSVYLCGTSSFMGATEKLLKDAGFDMQHFHQESFTPTPVTGAPRSICVDDDEVFTVKVPKFGFENTLVEKDALLLDTLTDADLPIVAACHSGLCGSCMCKVTNGKVESSSTGPLNQRQIEEGYVLACCSTIIADVEIEL